MSTTSRQRLDLVMVEKGLVESRERAKRIILSGAVYVAGQRIDKAGTFVSPEDDIYIERDSMPFVSRGGLKLEKALDYFKPPVNGRVYLDVGASTGGFTDCLLQYGAKKVYAIDVGYGQLAWTLRQDKRVVVMERTNIRNVTRADFDVSPQGAVVDVSFISLKVVLPVIKGLLLPDSHIIALVKPQFEAGPKKVGKKGVVRSQETHREVLESIVSTCYGLGFTVEGLTFSPIKGPKGNVEFLIHLYNNHEDSMSSEGHGAEIKELIVQVVSASHTELNK
jgi:23S rRNA (cytidine1920-2'-O)/16S rRNA (cytidine1409-2'-O)-methyltransferase